MFSVSIWRTWRLEKTCSSLSWWTTTHAAGRSQVRSHFLRTERHFKTFTWKILHFALLLVDLIKTPTTVFQYSWFIAAEIWIIKEIWSPALNKMLMLESFRRLYFCCSEKISSLTSPLSAAATLTKHEHTVIQRLPLALSLDLRWQSELHLWGAVMLHSWSRTKENHCCFKLGLKLNMQTVAKFRNNTEGSILCHFCHVRKIGNAPALRLCASGRKVSKWRENEGVSRCDGCLMPCAKRSKHASV